MNLDQLLHTGSVVVQDNRDCDSHLVAISLLLGSSNGVIRPKHYMPLYFSVEVVNPTLVSRNDALTRFGEQMSHPLTLKFTYMK